MFLERQSQCNRHEKVRFKTESRIIDFSCLNIHYFETYLHICVFLSFPVLGVMYENSFKCQ